MMNAPRVLSRRRFVRVIDHPDGLPLHHEFILLDDVVGDAAAVLDGPAATIVAGRMPPPARGFHRCPKWWVVGRVHGRDKRTIRGLRRVQPEAWPAVQQVLATWRITVVDARTEAA
jgi:hypothetical protein